MKSSSHIVIETRIPATVAATLLRFLQNRGIIVHSFSQLLRETARIVAMASDVQPPSTAEEAFRLFREAGLPLQRRSSEDKLREAAAAVAERLKEKSGHIGSNFAADVSADDILASNKQQQTEGEA